MRPVTTNPFSRHSRALSVLDLIPVDVVLLSAILLLLLHQVPGPVHILHSCTQYTAHHVSLSRRPLSFPQGSAFNTIGKTHITDMQPRCCNAGWCLSASLCDRFHGDRLNQENTHQPASLMFIAPTDPSQSFFLGPDLFLPRLFLAQEVCSTPTLVDRPVFPLPVLRSSC